MRSILLAGAWSALTPALSFAQSAGQPAANELTPAQRGVDDSKFLADPNWKPVFFSEQQNETLIALSDVIIPPTDTPGARDALVNRYLDLVLSGETGELQQQFLSGLSFIDSESKRLYRKEFRALNAEEQVELLLPLAYPTQGHSWNSEEAPEEGVRHFGLLKGMIAGAYYTSEIGLQELGWDGSFTHGPYQGCEHSDPAHK